MICQCVVYPETVDEININTRLFDPKNHPGAWAKDNCSICFGEGIIDETSKPSR